MTKSDLVRVMIKKKGMTIADAANCLGITVGYFYNKLHRNSFKLEDFIVLSQYLGIELVICPTIKSVSIEINFDDFFDTDSDESKRLLDIKRLEKEQAHAEYEKLKHEIAILNEIYGFDD